MCLQPSVIPCDWAIETIVKPPQSLHIFFRRLDILEDCDVLENERLRWIKNIGDRALCCLQEK
jgi:hypothetical protein